MTTETRTDAERLRDLADDFDGVAASFAHDDASRGRWREQARLLRHVAAEAEDSPNGRTASSAFWAEAGETILEALEDEIHASTSRGQQALDGARVEL